MTKTIMSKDFMLGDGKKISTIEELIPAIDSMREGVFRQHVSDVHNDFADWIEDAFDERMLANELRVATSNLEMMESLRRFLSARTATPSASLAEAPPDENKLVQEAHSLDEGEVAAGAMPSTDYHEDSAPTMQTDVQQAVQSDSQTIDAASIMPQENLVVGDPSKAPIIDMGGETAADSSEPLIPEVAETAVSAQLPQASAVGVLPGQKFGINQTASPVMFQMMMVYRYLLMVLSFGMFKIEPVTTPQPISPKLAEPPLSAPAQ